MIEIIINNFLNYEFVYIFLFCFLVFLFISLFIKQKILRKISVLVFSICFILFCFEFGLSFFMPLACTNYDKSYISEYNPDIISQERQVVRLLLSNNETYEECNNDINFDGAYSDKLGDSLLVFDKTYSHYDNSFRITKCNNISEEVFVFLGCSFIFGLGLNDDETLPYFFSKEFDFEINVINCGVPGHSSNTALNILNNGLFLPLIKNKNSKIKHFFYSLIHDHIYRNFRYEHYSCCIDGYLYKNNEFYISTTIGKIKYVFAKSYIFRKVFLPIIYRKFELKKYYEDYMVESLLEMNKIINNKYNSKLTIIVWPDFNYEFIIKLQETNLDLIFLPEYFNSEDNGYKIKYDGHPSAKANKEIAEILYNHINEQDKKN